MSLSYLLTAENVATTIEAETATAVSQQTSEADDDEDEVTPVTDSQTQTGISTQSTVRQYSSSGAGSYKHVIIITRQKSSAIRAPTYNVPYE